MSLGQIAEGTAHTRPQPNLVVVQGENAASGMAGTVGSSGATTQGCPATRIRGERVEELRPTDGRDGSAGGHRRVLLRTSSHDKGRQDGLSCSPPDLRRDAVAVHGAHAAHNALCGAYGGQEREPDRPCPAHQHGRAGRDHATRAFSHAKALVQPEAVSHDLHPAGRGAPDLDCGALHVFASVLFSPGR